MFGYLCEECHEGKVWETTKKNYEVNFHGETFIVPKAVIGVCDHCGAVVYHGKEMHRWRDLYRTWQVKSGKFLSPAGIRRIRNSLSMNQTEFAQFLGVTRQSLSVWENEKRPSVQPKNVDIVLRMLYDELDLTNKPVTEKMIAQYRERTGRMLSIESRSIRDQRNALFKEIMPKSTWRILEKKAEVNNTDPYTEIVRLAESMVYPAISQDDIPTRIPQTYKFSMMKQSKLLDTYGAFLSYTISKSWKELHEINKYFTAESSLHRKKSLTYYVSEEKVKYGW